MSAPATEPLLDWSLRVWTVEGVQTAALDLQDAQGQNLPLLLWAAWCAQTGRAPGADDIEAACDTARAWSDTTVAPLRAIRRTLKKPVPDIDDGAREAVRERIKAVELLAERHLLEALEALAPEPSGPVRPASEALVSTARIWARVVPRPALTRLAERLPA